MSHSSLCYHKTIVTVQDWPNAPVIWPNAPVIRPNAPVIRTPLDGHSGRDPESTPHSLADTVQDWPNAPVIRPNAPVIRPPLDGHSGRDPESTPHSLADPEQLQTILNCDLNNPLYN